MKISLGRILREHRAVALPLAIALVANVAVYAFLVYPLQLRVRSMETRALEATQELKAAERDAAAAKAVQSGQGKARDQLQTFYTEILPADLAGARRITYLHLAQLAEQTNLRSERRSASPALERDSALGRLDITMVLEGEYDDIRQFVYQLESAPEFVVIDDIGLTEGAEANAPLVLTLQLSAYYRAPENHGA
jgi:Tfp pilus assembly protein PilO